MKEIKFEENYEGLNGNTPIHILDVDNIYVHVENGVIIIEKNDKSKMNEEQYIDILKECYEVIGAINSDIEQQIKDNLSEEFNSAELYLKIRNLIKNK